MANLSYKINKIIRDYVVFIVDDGGNSVDNDTSGNNKTSFIQTKWKEFLPIFKNGICIKKIIIKSGGHGMFVILQNWLFLIKRLS